MARYSGGNILAAKFHKLGLKRRSGGICKNIQGMKIIQKENQLLNYRLGISTFTTYRC